jgi:hypothetical protein
MSEMNRSFAAVLAVASAGLVLLASAPRAASADPSRTSDAAQKNERTVVVVRGCVESGTLTSVSAGEGDATGTAVAGQTYRIAGPRALVKQLRREHEGHTEEITGRIKGELAPKSTVRQKQVGKIGIVVGTTPGGGGSNAPHVPEMPSIEIEAFQHVENHCVR